MMLIPVAHIGFSAIIAYELDFLRISFLTWLHVKLNIIAVGRVGRDGFAALTTTEGDWLKFGHFLIPHSSMTLANL